MTSQAMVEEFDTFATWTADAVAELGPAHAEPAGCRGSGSPAGLDWLADQLRFDHGTRLLDSGAGVGGPAAYAARTRGVLPTLVEPMEGACRAAARLFAHPTVVGDGDDLPFHDGLFDVAWSLGVLCTVQDKTRHLTELARMVGRGGAVGLLVFVRTVDQLPHEPSGNLFPDRLELETAVGRAGLEIRDDVWMGDLADCPDEWRRATAEVDGVIERDHGQEEGFVVAQQQSERIGRLLADGLVVAQLLSCRTRTR